MCPKLPWAEVAGPIWVFRESSCYLASSSEAVRSLRYGGVRDSPATAELKLRELVTFLVKTTCGLAGLIPAVELLFQIDRRLRQFRHQRFDIVHLYFPFLTSDSRGPLGSCSHHPPSRRLVDILQAAGHALVGADIVLSVERIAGAARVVGKVRNSAAVPETRHRSSSSLSKYLTITPWGFA